MKKCKNCGREIPDEANFCPYCESMQVKRQAAKAPLITSRRLLYIAAVIIVLQTLLILWLIFSPERSRTAGPENGRPPAGSEVQTALRTGLYGAAEGDLPSGDIIGMIKDGDGPWVYRIEYASGPDFKGLTLYYYDTHYKFRPDYSLDTGYENVSVTRVNESMLRIELGAGCSGGYRLDFDIGDGSFPMFFIDTN